MTNLWWYVKLNCININIFTLKIWNYLWYWLLHALVLQSNNNIDIVPSLVCSVYSSKVEFKYYVPSTPGSVLHGKGNVHGFRHDAPWLLIHHESLIISYDTYKWVPLKWNLLPFYLSYYTLVYLVPIIIQSCIWLIIGSC